MLTSLKCIEVSEGRGELVERNKPSRRLDLLVYLFRNITATVYRAYLDDQTSEGHTVSFNYIRGISLLKEKGIFPLSLTENLL